MKRILDAFVQQVAFALRTTRRSPGFALAVVATLGLGLGANAVMFGVVDRLLLSPPQHIVDADQVRHVYVQRRSVVGGLYTGRFLTYPDFEALRGVDGFADVAAYTSILEQTLGRGEGAEKIRVVQASASLFPLLGVRPALGRFYGPEEDAVGADPVAVLSHEFWTRRFGADPGILGEELEIGRGRFRVIGVAPAGFTGAELRPVDVWTPIVTSVTLGGTDTRGLDSTNNWWLFAVVRMEPGASEAAAQDEASAIHVGLRPDPIARGSYDPEARILTAPVIAARGPTPSDEAAVTRWLAGVSLLVLIIACANVANLFLARSVRWRRELAVRVSLGVSRARLLAQLLVESAFLAALGAAAALGVAVVGGRVVHQTLLPNVAFTDAALGPRLLAFLAAAAAVTALLAGLVPALQASRPGATEALKGSGTVGAGHRSRARAAFLLGQAALSVVLLVGAGLFVKSLHRAGTLDLGYDYDRVVVAKLEWNGTLPVELRADLYRDALDRVARVPAVQEAALTYTLFFWSSISVGAPRVPGLDSFPRAPSGGPYVNKVGSGYFETMGLSITRGRAFGPADDRKDARPVTVVSQSMAGDAWPNENPIGRCIHLGDDAPCTQVVGVVENHRRQELVEDQAHHLYYVNLHHPDLVGPPQAMVIRGSGDLDALGATVAAVIRRGSPDVRFVDVRRMEELISPALRSWRLGATMFTVFGALALLVAAVGLYSVLAFEVAQRGRELGLRSALGATRSRLMFSVFRRAMLVAVGGLSLGFALAWGAGRFIEPLLFRVSSTDPLVYGGVVVALGLAAVAAAALPGWRATHVMPAVALRAE